MNKATIIADTPGNKITYFHLAAFVILLPYDRFYSELVLISLLLHTIIHLTPKRARCILSLQNLVLASVFLLTIVGMMYSADKAQALKDMQRQLAIILFPIILSATGIDLRLYRERLLKLLGWTCVITILFLYADAIRIILYYRLPFRSLFSPAFINHNFSEPIGLHATYFSMYTALSVAFFCWVLPGAKTNMTRVIYLIGIGILLSGLVQLASRSVLITTMILLIPGVSFFILRGVQRIRFAAVWLLVIGIGILAVSKLDSFKKRYVENFRNDLIQSTANNELLEPRVTRWHYAMKLVGQSPVIGYGSGAEKRILKNIYFENKLYNSYVHELNAHNQYLSILLKTGISGLLIFLFTLVWGFVYGLKRRDIILLSFMTLISIVAFSENILDVNKGIFFYGFFFSFLVKSCQDPVKPPSQS